MDTNDATVIELTRDLRAAGYSSSDLLRLTRASEWMRVRRGAYLRLPADDADLRAAHRRLVMATMRQMSAEAVVSHESASVLHGLPIWGDVLSQVQVTRNRAGGGRARRWVHVHGVRLDSDDVVAVDGLLVTSVSRTVVDLACSSPIGRAVAVGDAALRQGVRRDDLDNALLRAGRRLGISTARRMVTMVDARSESPGESVSRVVLVGHGLPAPELQYEVRENSGQLVGRADFCWPEERTLGEFDGRVKYGRLMRHDLPLEDVLYAEKRREDALRELGWKMIRWCWADLDNPAVLAARVRRILRQRVAA